LNPGRGHSWISSRTWPDYPSWGPRKLLYWTNAFIRKQQNMILSYNIYCEQKYPYVSLAFISTSLIIVISTLSMPFSFLFNFIRSVTCKHDWIAFFVLCGLWMAGLASYYAASHGVNQISLCGNNVVIMEKGKLAEFFYKFVWCYLMCHYYLGDVHI